MDDNQRREAILGLTRAMAGETAEEAVLGALCDAAAAELAARLRTGVSPGDLGSQFVTAAGVLALSMYCAVSDPERIRSFRAGDVSVHCGDGALSAAKLRAAAEQMLAGALADRGFGCTGVAG